MKHSSPASNFSVFPTIIYNLFVRTVKFDNHKIIKNVRRYCFEKARHVFKSSILTKIHGFPVVANFGYMYPLLARINKKYNNPLVELTYRTFVDKGGQIDVMDIGAAIGDTALLLYRNCPDMIQSLYCLEGELEFFGYLQKNLSKIKGARLINALLSDEEKLEPEVIHLQPGTASAQGGRKVRSKTIDSLWTNGDVSEVDIIKIDVDGFDGKVLKGARRFLKQYKPKIIFEWHPIYCVNTKNNWTDHFDVLSECGYNRFLFFDKFGNFSHYMSVIDAVSIDMLADLCLHSKSYHDWHYDVIALPSESHLSTVELADMSYANGKQSNY